MQESLSDIEDGYFLEQASAFQEKHPLDIFKIKNESKEFVENQKEGHE